MIRLKNIYNKTKLPVLVFLSIIFWPLNLFINNSPKTFLVSVAPAILTALSYQEPLFLLFIPIISPKLLLFPLIFILVVFYFKKISKTNVFLFLIFYSFIFLLRWPDFYNQSIFPYDYEAQQQVVRDTQLYDSVFLARLFHNKAKIRIDDFNTNLFSLLDPNNYFFNFHPRLPLSPNQMLSKYGFATFVPLLIGFINLNKIKYKEYLISVFIGALVSLSFLKIFDAHDFILWIPLSILISSGLSKIDNLSNRKNYFGEIYAVVLLIELVRLVIK